MLLVQLCPFNKNIFTPYHTPKNYTMWYSFLPLLESVDFGIKHTVNLPSSFL